MFSQKRVLFPYCRVWFCLGKSACDFKKSGAKMDWVEFNTEDNGGNALLFPSKKRVDSANVNPSMSGREALLTLNATNLTLFARNIQPLLCTCPSHRILFILY